MMLLHAILWSLFAMHTKDEDIMYMYIEAREIFCNLIERKEKESEYQHRLQVVLAFH